MKGTIHGYPFKHFCKPLMDWVQQPLIDIVTAPWGKEPSLSVSSFGATQFSGYGRWSGLGSKGPIRASNQSNFGYSGQDQRHTAPWVRVATKNLVRIALLYYEQTSSK